jgi:[ribosomal protein S5]-alanine N-acetyltransferase
MQLAGKGFILRTFQDSDADSLASHANDMAIWQNLRNRFPHPYSLEDAQKWIEYAQNQHPTLNFAIVVEGAAVGCIGLTPKEDVYTYNMELGYWLGQAYWNKGIMTQAVKLVRDYAFDTFDIKRLYAITFGFNKASIKVLRRAGFRKEAHIKGVIFKNGKFTDRLEFAVRAK